MPTYKVDELEAGPLLDAAVALAEGYVWDGRHFSKPPRIVHGKPVEVAVCPGDCRDEAGYPMWCRYHPSGDTHGDEIIDRERIATMVLEGQWRAWMPDGDDAMAGYAPSYWLFEQTTDQAHGSGPTRRVAAMRAFVKKKVGETVDLP